jgi:hypothetical protein
MESKYGSFIPMSFVRCILVWNDFVYCPDFIADSIMYFGAKLRPKSTRIGKKKLSWLWKIEELFLRYYYRIEFRTNYYSCFHCHSTYLFLFPFYRHNLHHYINFFKSIQQAIKDNELQALQSKLDLFVSSRRNWKLQILLFFFLNSPLSLIFLFKIGKGFVNV